MSRSFVIAVMLLPVVLAPAPANATVSDSLRTAASATARGLDKAGEAVAHAAKVAVGGVELGVNKAGAAVTHVAKKLGVPEGESGPAPKYPTTPTQ